MNNQSEALFDISYTLATLKAYPEFQQVRATREMQQVTLSEAQIIKKSTNQRLIFRGMKLREKEVEGIRKFKEYLEEM